MQRFVKALKQRLVDRKDRFVHSEFLGTDCGGFVETFDFDALLEQIDQFAEEFKNEQHQQRTARHAAKR